jgi:hypothetical protein
MNYRTLKMLGVLAGFALFGALTAQAQDKATLDLLVQKGLISQADEDSLGKSAAEVQVTSRSSNVGKIRLEGGIQFQYNNMSLHQTGPIADPPATNQMYFRRVMMGMNADLSNGWSGEILMDFAATQIADQPKSGLSPQAFPTTASTVGGQQGIQYISQNMFDKIAIYKAMPDWSGIGEIGYDKVNFVQEEQISSFALPAIERSMATRYFDEYYGSATAYRLSFAQRRTGLFWKGTVPNTGLYYSASLNNGVNSNINYTNIGGLDKFGAWTGVGYKGTVGGLNYDVGLDLGYDADGNSQSANDKVTPVGAGIATPNQANPMYGWNPYVNLTYGKFHLLTEFFQSRVTNGRSTAPFTATSQGTYGVTSAAMPYGLNIIPTYDLTDKWQLAARFTYLSTNGRGTDQNGVLWNGPNVNSSTLTNTVAAPSGGALGPLFDNAAGVYLGFNYFIIGHSVELSAGYEHDWFQGRQVYVPDASNGGIYDGTSKFNGPSAQEDVVRIQFQVMW